MKDEMYKKNMKISDIRTDCTNSQCGEDSLVETESLIYINKYVLITSIYHNFKP